MKIKLSKSQWELIGQKTGWSSLIKSAADSNPYKPNYNEEEAICKKCKHTQNHMTGDQYTCEKCGGMDAIFQKTTSNPKPYDSSIPALNPNKLMPSLANNSNIKKK